MAGPWEKYQQPSTGPVYGPADPYKQSAEVRAQQDQDFEAQRLEMERQRLDIAQQSAARDARKDAQAQAEQEELAKAQAAGIQDSIYQMAGVVDAARKAKRLSKGWFATGFGASQARNVGGTTAADVAALLNTIGANTAFDRLQKMRDESPTGGALGQVSEIELRLLRDSIASVDQSQSDEQFRENMDRVIEAYTRVIERLGGTVPPDEDVAGGEEPEGITGTVTDESGAPPPATPDGSGMGGGIDRTGPLASNPSGGQGLIDLGMQGITLGLSDEAAGIGGMISSIFTGEDSLDAYRRARDAERQNLAQAREAWPALGTGMELLGGAGSVRALANAPNAFRNIVQQGAGIGALGGFGYGEGGQGSVGNALIGAAAGGALGGAMAGGANALGGALSRRAAARAPTPEQRALVEAGERQGVPLRQPDVRPELRNRMAQAETTPAGGPMIREARARDVARMEERIGEVAGSGSPADPFALGGKVQEAGRNYIARTRQQANRLYDRARQEAQGQTVQPSEAVAALDNHIAELRAAGENSNRGQITYLEGLRDDLSKPISIESVQNLRTNMRGQISERGLTGTDADRRVADVIDAANRDLARDLPQSASNALRAADAFYKERQTFINDTLKQFLGSRGNPLHAETAASRLVSMAQGKGNYERFSAMWKQLEPADQADLAATIAESLGRKANGEFSPATLIRSLDPNKGINPRTARLIFGDEGAQALSDLRAIARAKTDTQSALNNSRTGVTVNETTGGLKKLMWSLFGFSQGGAVGAVAAPAASGFVQRIGEKRAARLLLNPDFTKWLRNAPNTTNPRAIDRYFSRLSGVIAANDNLAIQSGLRNIVANSSGRAAADDETNTGREPPQ